MFMWYAICIMHSGCVIEISSTCTCSYVPCKSVNLTYVCLCVTYAYCIPGCVYVCVCVCVCMRARIKYVTMVTFTWVHMVSGTYPQLLSMLSC